MKTGQGAIVLVQGDITRQQVDVIVTAANAGLRGGGGVDAAVHGAAGPELLQACRAIGGCPTGSAVITPAFNLRSNGVRHVVHAVGPIWHGGGEGEEDDLRGAYRRSLELADENGLTSIAFPSISTGVYGFPIDRAAPIAVDTARAFLEAGPSSVARVVFVLFDAGAYGVFLSAVDPLGWAVSTWLYHLILFGLA